MRIVFLETESWEEECPGGRLSGHELQLFEDSLRESAFRRIEAVDVILPFTYSRVGEAAVAALPP